MTITTSTSTATTTTTEKENCCLQIPRINSPSLSPTPPSSLHDTDIKSPSSPPSPLSSHSSLKCPSTNKTCETSKEECTYNGCTNPAQNFFQDVRLHQKFMYPNGVNSSGLIRRKNVFLCDLCLKYVPLPDLRKNPPVII